MHLMASCCGCHNLKEPFLFVIATGFNLEVISFNKKGNHGHLYSSVCVIGLLVLVLFLYHKLSNRAVRFSSNMLMQTDLEHLIKSSL